MKIIIIGIVSLFISNFALTFSLEDLVDIYKDKIDKPATEFNEWLNELDCSRVEPLFKEVEDFGLIGDIQFANFTSLRNKANRCKEAKRIGQPQGV